ncbi:MAG: hypothetical protein AB1801_07870 [Chloroflexota bacterium]
MPTLDEAIATIRSGNAEQGRRMLEEILEVDENNEDVWLWLSSVVDNNEDREICLENVLALNSNNVVAKKGLEALRAGTFNVHNIFGEFLEEEEVLETTFIDEFMITGDSAAEEIEFPSTMAPPKGKKKKAAKKGGGINLRIVLIIVFLLVLIMALGGLAVMNLFFSGGNGESTGPTEGQPQEVPVQGSEEAPPEPTATETPTPLPTDTPTPTKTAFVLPTPKPTDLPTPTATPVVPPTPQN